MCQSASGAQNNLGNKNDCIVETEKSNGKEIFRKIVDVGKKFKNKLKEVNNSIPKEVYTAAFTSFSVRLMYEISK